MRDIYCTLALLMLCGFGPDELSASAELRTVGPGDDVVLPCSLALNRETSWYRQLSDTMIPLTTTSRSNLDNTTTTSYHVADNGHFVLQEDNRTKSFSLRIIGVGESDRGLYYCVGRDGSKILFGKGVGLAITDSGPERPSLSCWTLLALVPAAVAMATAVCTCGLCHRKALGRSICSNCVKDEDRKKDVNLHYASLHLNNKPRPPQQRETPPLSGDITYAALALQPLTTQTS